MSDMAEKFSEALARWMRRHEPVGGFKTDLGYGIPQGIARYVDFRGIYPALIVTPVIMLTEWDRILDGLGVRHTIVRSSSAAQVVRKADPAQLFVTNPEAIMACYQELMFKRPKLQIFYDLPEWSRDTKKARMCHAIAGVAEVVFKIGPRADGPSAQQILEEAFPLWHAKGDSIIEKTR
jgi:hypothetical protein